MFGLSIGAIVSITLAVLAAFWAAVNKEKIKATVQGVNPFRASAKRKKVHADDTDVEDVEDMDVLSAFISRLANLPIFKKLDVSRDSIVRSFLGMMIIKIGDYIKASALPEDQKTAGLNALNVLTPLIMVQQTMLDTESAEKVTGKPVL